MGPTISHRKRRREQAVRSGDADDLVGGKGNETLDGGIGEDSMSGAEGNDTYLVDSFFGDTLTGDQVFEDAAAGSTPSSVLRQASSC